jgi:hypothetical protein
MFHVAPPSETSGHTTHSDRTRTAHVPAAERRFVGPQPTAGRRGRGEATAPRRAAQRRRGRTSGMDGASAGPRPAHLGRLPARLSPAFSTTPGRRPGPPPRGRRGVRTTVCLPGPTVGRPPTAHVGGPRGGAQPVTPPCVGTPVVPTRPVISAQTAGGPGVRPFRWAWPGQVPERTIAAARPTDRDPAAGGGRHSRLCGSAPHTCPSLPSRTTTVGRLYRRAGWNNSCAADTHALEPWPRSV